MTNYPTKKLGEVCEISAGGSAPQGKRFFEGGKYPFFRTSDVGAVHLSENLCDTRDYLNDEGIKKLKLFKTGTILFPKSGASTFLNHRVIMGCDGYVASHLATISAGKNIDNRYLYFFLILIDAGNIAPNSSYPSLRISDVAKIEIPLPPLAEQKKIVARLEKLLGKVKEAKRLREEAQSASAGLLPAELHKIFEEGKKKGWEEKELGKVLDKIVGGGTPSKSNNSYWNGDIPWASVKDVKENQYVLTKTEDFITKKGLENSAANLIPKGTIVISTRMGLGRVVKTEIDTAINQDLKALFPKKELENDFLLWFYISMANDIAAHGTGATVSGVRLEYIRSIKIPLPPIAEQKKIVARLDALSEKVKKLQEYQKSTASDFIALEQSLLQQAFSGHS